MVSFADSDEDNESVHEASVDLAGSTAKKRKRTKQTSRTPENIVSLNFFLLEFEFNYVACMRCIDFLRGENLYNEADMGRGPY